MLAEPPPATGQSVIWPVSANNRPTAAEKQRVERQNRMRGTASKQCPRLFTLEQTPSQASRATHTGQAETSKQQRATG